MQNQQTIISSKVKQCKMQKEILRNRALKMRKSPTVEENKMWHILLKRMKPRFLRQYVMGNYIVDFYCPKLKLIIEIDGEQHYLPESEEYEKVRTAFLTKEGCKILRFYNSDINRKIKNVEHTVRGVCEERARVLGIDVEILFVK